MTSTSAKVLHAIRITPDKTKAPLLVKRTYHFPNNLISATAAISISIGVENESNHTARSKSGLFLAIGFGGISPCRMSIQQTATALREAGNECYKKRDYEGAIERYTESLKKEETAAWYLVFYFV